MSRAAALGSCVACAIVDRAFARHYIVSFFSTLGTRYTDADRLQTLAQPRDPLSPPPIATTQTVPQLGATLDAWLALWLETPQLTRCAPASAP